MLYHLNKYQETALALDDWGLKSLPDIFGKQPLISRLTHLNISSNQLTSILKEIGRLQNLKQLYLYHNQLTSIPKKIGRLQHLEILILSSNQLTSIPKRINQLQNLKKLYLYNNQLTSIPKEIGQLQHLEVLDLSSNQLTSIPQKIGQLQQLRILKLWNNPTLQRLPDGLLCLTRSCTVDIRMTGLSEPALSDLQAAYNAEHYRGPNIFFPMGRMQQYHHGQPQPLPLLIKNLFFVLKEEPKSFFELYQLDEKQRNSVRDWLSRLSYTADYQPELRVLDNRQCILKLTQI